MMSCLFNAFSCGSQQAASFGEEERCSAEQQGHGLPVPSDIARYSSGSSGQYSDDTILGDMVQHGMQRKGLAAGGGKPVKGSSGKSTGLHR